MNLQVLDGEFSVCKLENGLTGDLPGDFLFYAKTDEEFSLVCPSECVPANAQKTQPEWRALRIAGELDFSLTGVIAGLAGILAERQIPVFVVSTYNTDYLLVNKHNLETACQAFSAAGHHILR